MPDGTSSDASCRSIAPMDSGPVVRCGTWLPRGIPLKKGGWRTCAFLCVDTHLYFGSVTKSKELDADGLVDLYVLMDVVEETAGGINKENLYDTAVAAGTK